jgi:hypothetical protein
MQSKLKIAVSATKQDKLLLLDHVVAAFRMNIEFDRSSISFG